MLEILWRGHSHWSMSIAGGLCFLCICIVNRFFQKRGLCLKCLCCALSITIIEFVIGCMVNLMWDMHVWDYSALPFNVLGQICLPFFAVWFALSIPALKLGSLIDKLFDALPFHLRKN